MHHPLLRHGYRFVAIIVGLATICGALDTSYWSLELFAHFLVQYLLLSVLLLPFALFYRHWGTVIILLLIAGLNGHELWRVATVYSHAPVNCEGQPTIHILQSNFYYRNTHADDAANALIRLSEQADIVVINEFNPEWRKQQADRFKKRFPHSFVTWKDGNIEEMAIFSREPFSVQQRSGWVANNAHLRLTFPTLGLTFVTYHGFTPLDAYRKRERDREIRRIAKDMKRLHSPALLTGDFNQSPYATSFQRALTAGSLWFAPFPQGLLPTWPRMWFTVPFVIPIDHMLVNEHARICRREVISIPGSDHGAVLNEILLLPDVPNFSELQHPAKTPRINPLIHPLLLKPSQGAL